MTAGRALAVPAGWWTPRRSRRLLVGIHLPIVAISPVNTALGLEGRPAGSPWVVAALGLALAALQLLHTFAAVRGRRPRGWPWTLLALAALVYVPLPWFGWSWGGTQICLIASLAVHLRLPTRFVATLPALGTFAVCLAVDNVLFALYWLVTLLGFALALCGSVHLVRSLGDLHATWLELPESAVDEERSRLARDLHDLLGQSLTAVSLRGDLALALLGSDRAAAEAEIRILAAIARDALRDTRKVIHGRHIAAFGEEITRAMRLLEAAGVDAQVDVADVQPLDPEVEGLLAWATREGVTNLVRHSYARRSSIMAARSGGRVRLEIVNDGVGPRPAEQSGHGLAGLAERAGALGGTLTTAYPDHDHFLLCVEVPC
jgi:two-component system sensor histidine kinase DesK